MASHHLDVQCARRERERLLLLLERALGAATHMWQLRLAAETTVKDHRQTLRDLNTLIQCMRRTRRGPDRAAPRSGPMTPARIGAAAPAASGIGSRHALDRRRRSTTRRS